MSELVLPIPPFIRREKQVLNGEVRYLTIELDSQGFIHQRIEYEAPDPDTGLTIWKVPYKLDPKFDNYGKSIPIITQWRKNLYHNGKFVRHLNDEIEEMTSNHPDMIDFGAMLGLAIAFAMMNGETRALEDYDKHPPFVRNAQGGMDFVTYETYVKEPGVYEQHRAKLVNEPVVVPEVEETPEPTTEEPIDDEIHPDEPIDKTTEPDTV